MGSDGNDWNLSEFSESVAYIGLGMVCFPVFGDCIGSGVDCFAGSGDVAGREPL